MGSFKNLSLFPSKVIFLRECDFCIGINLNLLIFVSLFTVDLITEPSDKTLTLIFSLMLFSLCSLKTISTFSVRHYSNNEHHLILKFSNIVQQFSDRTRPFPLIAKRPLNKHPFEYNTLMKQYSKSGKYWEVLRLFKEMKFVNCKADIVCYSTVIDSLVRFNRPKEAKVIFAEMVVLGLHFDLASYTILVKLYSCCLRVFDLAHEVMRMMVRNGISPDLITYSTLITGLCWDLRIDEALDVLDWMIEVDCIPNAYTFTPIVQAYCYIGKIKEAKQLLATMEKIGCLPNVVTYNILIEALCKDRKFDEVEMAFKESRMKSWEPDEISYSIYMDGLCKIGLHRKAFQLVDVMIGKGLKPNEVTLNILLNSLCRGSNILGAKFLLEKSSGLSWNVANYNTVMSRLCDFGLWLDVLKLFTNMLKKGVDVNVRTFSILIDSFCIAGKFHMAKCLLDNNRSLSNVVTYTTLIHHFYLAGKINDAYLLFSKMEEENIFPNVVTYSIMINCLCKEGKFIEAIKCFHKSLKDGFSPPLAATIVERLIGGGRFSDASYFIKQIGLLGYSLDSCFVRSVINSYYRMGYWHKAEIYRLCHLLEKMIMLGAGY